MRGLDRNTWQSWDAAGASMFTYGKVLLFGKNLNISLNLL